MIIIHFASGRERLIEGESWKKLDQETAALGQVRFKTHPDGFPFGSCAGTAYKSNVEEVIEISDLDYKNKIEEQKKLQADRAASEQQLADLVKQRQELEAAAAAEARKPWNRFKAWSQRVCGLK